MVILTGAQAPVFVCKQIIMPMDLSQNYFELFGLSEQFAIDQHHLRQQYRELQARFHPDKFASKGSSERRLAEQFSGLINTAYQTLSAPLLRAEYLLSLAGSPVNNETLTINDGAFLFKQMEWRESLEEINLDDVEQAEQVLEALTQEVSLQDKQLSQQFVAEINQHHFDECSQVIAKWHFVKKMQCEIERLEDKNFDANH